MIETAKKAVSETKNVIEKDKMTLESLEKRISKLEKELEEADINQIKKELRDIRAEISVLSDYVKKGSKIKEYDEKIKDIYSSLGKQKVEIDTLSSDLSSLKDEVVSWKSRLDDVSSKIDELESQISQFSQSLEKVDLMETDISSIAQTMDKLLDKLLVLEQEIGELKSRQKAILDWSDQLKKNIGSLEIKVKKPKFEDKEILDLKTKLREIGKEIPQKLASRKAEKKPGIEAPLAKGVRSTITGPGMPVIEEITVGESKREVFDEKVDKIVSKIKNTDPRKWDPLKKELSNLLTDELNKLKSKIKTKKPANEKTLNLMLSRAELGVISLSAAFESRDPERVELIVRKTLETIRDVRDQLR